MARLLFYAFVPLIDDGARRVPEMPTKLKYVISSSACQDRRFYTTLNMFTCSWGKRPKTVWPRSSALAPASESRRLCQLFSRFLNTTEVFPRLLGSL
jgi:hypothetical protein